MGEKGARLTSASESFHERVLGALEPLGGVSSRKMFGGFGIFHDGAMFGLISKTRLFFKVDASNLSDYEAAGSERHRPMPYYSVPEAVVAAPARLSAWARKAIAVAHAAEEKKPATRPSAARKK